MKIVDERTGNLRCFGDLEYNDAFIMPDTGYENHLCIKVHQEGKNAIYDVLAGEIGPALENTVTVVHVETKIVIKGTL